MSLTERLPARNGSRARGKRIYFEFDGRRYQGFEGDTLSAALLANAVTVVGRSFKLHRPRGIMSAGVEEANALVRLETGGFAEPNVRATLVPLYDGLRAFSQNAWPTIEWDCLGLLDYLHRLLPASFYYKSMMWPSWRFFERHVRKLAGLGKAPEGPDPQHYHKRNLQCDVLICGAGPAGLNAALAAGRTGLRVVLVDSQECLGGSLLYESYGLGELSASEWIARTSAELRRMPNVRLLVRTMISGYYENNFLAAAERVTQHIGPQAPMHLPRERLWRIRARAVILATGAIERPLVFPNNDRPGVMLASAVRTYANRFGVVAGRHIVVATNHDNAYRTAFDLHALGLRSIVVIDTRRQITSSLMERTKALGIAVRCGHAVVDAIGRKKLRAIRLSEHLGDGRTAAATRTIACDVLAMSGGWTPSVHLFSQAGGALRFDERNLCFVPDRCEQNVRVVGAANGAFSLDACLEQGAAAAFDACRSLADLSEAERSHIVTRSGLADEELRIEPYCYTKDRRTDKQWLDFQYDVKVADIELAHRENFTSVEHVKRYTTGGMSVDQGKTSSFNILATLATLSQRTIAEVGTTRFRPPYHPVTLGTLAGATLGDRYAPWQELPAHEWHVANNAVFADHGWKRPDYYPRGDESRSNAAHREIIAVRQGVGIFDGSPLGKIEVHGPDAAAFLDYMYVNNVASLKPGFARYVMMTNDNGVLIDDGVMVRIAEDRFLVHATSGSVGRIHLWMEECLQCHRSALRVHLNDVTTQWANLTLSGPNARAVMQRLQSNIDFSAARFPHMQYREGEIEGSPARVLRASFTGEVTFEISVPRRYAMSLYLRVSSAGRDLQLTPYGIDALDVLRTEKGYLHIGGDTDGTTTPLDIGWGSIVEKKPGDFIGRRSLQRPAERRDDRLQFVGLEAASPSERLPVGGHVVTQLDPDGRAPSQGYVTAACISPTLGRSIGLGIVQAGASRLGEDIGVYSKGRVVSARIIRPSHFDPTGLRLNG